MKLTPLALAVALCALGVATDALGAWSPQKIEQATEYLQQYRKQWSRADTEALLAGHGERAVNIGGTADSGGTSMASIATDDGRRISLVASGDSLLIDGKDVTGNLGSKTTYGSNSPIIDNIKDSQIAAGSQNRVGRDTTTNYSLTISLSLALSVSVVLNLYLLRKSRGGGRAPPVGRK